MSAPNGPKPAPELDPDGILPKARAVRVSVTRRARTITVVCPWCRHTHVHGWPVEDAKVGVRVSHCHDARAGQGYLVTGELEALARWESGRW